jgi:hypothetical protein
MNFYCDVCDAPLAMTSKTNHLKSNKHLRNLGRAVETQPLGRPPAPQAIPYICEVCNYTYKPAYKETHLRTKKHQDNVRRSNEP